MGTDEFVVLRRKSTDAAKRWFSLKYYDTLEDANEFASKTRARSPGDLLLAISVDYLSDIPRYAHNLWFVGIDNKIKQASPIQWGVETNARTWLEFWEGPQADAYSMMNFACRCLPRQYIVLAVVGCARGFMPIEADSYADRTVKDAELWLDGKISTAEIKGNLALPFPRLTDRVAIDEAARQVACSTYSSYSAGDAIARMAVLMDGDMGENINKLAPTIERVNPLAWLLYCLTKG